jgi:hypothetical protein
VVDHLAAVVADLDAVADVVSGAGGADQVAADTLDEFLGGEDKSGGDRYE